MRQAVVIIHGIGDQRPMSTLRSFVSGVLKEGPADGRSFYSKPDRISDTLELRRLTADKSQTGDNPTDFYELYWQHLMTGTTYAHISAWLHELLIRRPRDVPKGVRPVWRSAWEIIILVILIGLLCLHYDLVRFQTVVAGGTLAVIVSLLYRIFANRLYLFGLKYVGDAARYLSPLPENVGVRHAIRSAGLDLLRGLHLDPLRRYERIVVVGHSLGSVIAYDVLTHLWQEMHNTVEQPGENGDPKWIHLDSADEHESDAKSADQVKLRDLQSLVAAQPDPSSYAGTWKCEYRKLQRELWSEYRSLGCPWRVTDLITLGSPLTYADFLMASNSDEFKESRSQREFPTCPPMTEDRRDDKDAPGELGFLQRISPAKDGQDKGTQLRILHHAALFACTRWTNLYFPGDIIGGKICPLFGPGILDKELKGCMASKRRSHVKYWEDSSALQTLRTALDLPFARSFPARETQDQGSGQPE